MKIFLLIIGLLLIGFICNHVNDEMQKMDTFSGIIIFVVVAGLVFIVITKNSDKK